MSRRPLLFAVSVLALTLPSVVPAAAAGDQDLRPAPSSGRLSATVTPRSLAKDTKVDVMVQLDADPVAVAEAKAERTFTDTERTAWKKKVRKAQDAITDDITARHGVVVSQVQSAYNGIRVRIKASQADSLATLPGVVGVHALTGKSLATTVSVPFLGVPQVWQSTGYTGKGVKVAVIDTGIDYTHADFGGPGTAEAFAKAAATSTAAADPTLFGPKAVRVKGGFDFVGDDYNSDAAPGSPAATPQPDPNPLDCNGHGTHVSGVVGGSGVTAAGATYSGAYNGATSTKKFLVGPGVAPKVDLYALRIFGCQGSTTLATEAIDWAVDHGMDVINLSLGNTFGRSTDPDAVAAANAAAAGVVVVSASGNEGTSPYLTGSPGAGDGVVSVAAVDGNATLPGALLKLGQDSLWVINTNDAKLPETPLTVVNVLDDPNTPEVESLGCSAAAFASAGIHDGGNQLAVVQRGQCARAAKAIFGQQSGAATVLMVNDEDALPPSEGTINLNPDDNTPYQVTIPFLGAPSSAAAAVAAAEAGSVTMSGLTLSNPEYRKIAAFSSAGPVNGDAGLSPNVSAPGVAIASAGIGTGNQSAVMSGTSMAAPHVAGVAALGVQAHPSWTGSQLSAAMVNTADPSAVAPTSVIHGGTGLVDAGRLVAARSFATGDAFRTGNGRSTEPSLSFGFAEPSTTFFGTRTITVYNRSDRTVTYRLSSQAGADSRPGRVVLGAVKVKVPARSKARVPVTLVVQASTIGSSLAEDQFGFREVSGTVLLTSDEEVLRVPYLLVPRARAQVQAAIVDRSTATLSDAAVTEADTELPVATEPEPVAPEPVAELTGDPDPAADASAVADNTDAATESVAPAATTPEPSAPEASPAEASPAEASASEASATDTASAAVTEVADDAAADPATTPNARCTTPVTTSLRIRLRNPLGALDASADFYTWGLSDAKDVARGSGGGGYDLRAAGVQSWDGGAGKVLVFAVNNHSRWSTAASQEFDISIDTNGDGNADYVVFSYDSGKLRNGDFNGITEVFLADVTTGALSATGYNAVAPTDSSTLLLPVNAADLGLSEQAGDFAYTVASYSVEDALAGDSFDGWASYNPWAKAVEDGAYLSVPRNRKTLVDVALNPDQMSSQRPLGVMVVSMDNASGAAEARLLRA